MDETAWCDNIRRLRLLRTWQVWNVVQGAKHETIVSLKAIYKVVMNNFYMKMWNVSQQKIKYIYLEETSSTNTSDHGGHLWPGHQILRDKLSLKEENVASSHSGSNTADLTLIVLQYQVDRIMTTNIYST